jgi:hypothetical protein
MEARCLGSALPTEDSSGDPGDYPANPPDEREQGAHKHRAYNPEEKY